MARPGIEPRASDLRVRCPTDCATWPGLFFKERICSQGSKFLPLRVDPRWGRWQNRKWQNCFPITCKFFSQHYHIYLAIRWVFHSLQWLQKTKSVLLNFAIIWVLPFLNNPKNLDLSYKFGLFWKGKILLITEEIWYMVITCTIHLKAIFSHNPTETDCTYMVRYWLVCSWICSQVN